MGKGKRYHDQRGKQAQPATRKATSRSIKRRQHSQDGVLAILGKSASTARGDNGSAKQSTKLKVPFSENDNVLLVGEGDFSFALSLAKHYKVASLLATSYDDEKSLMQKYPEIGKVLNTLKEPKHTIRQGPDNHDVAEETREEEWNGFPPEDEDTEPRDHEPYLMSTQVKVLHGIDATALSQKHKKSVDAHGPFTKIVFNFPHTGGLSKDVNRQVRWNQELLVGFFNAAKPNLATQARPAEALSNDTETDNLDYEFEGLEVKRESDACALSMGQILVTLFEGEPYTLWNIRDLARHCGLQVIESFKFPWAAYPGYKHARTIGDITTGKDRSEEGKRKGAWRGEERDARCYVLGLKDVVKGGHAAGQKRKRREESDDSE